jgi:hypothetical protein
MQKFRINLVLLGLCLSLIGLSLVGCNSIGKLPDAFDATAVEEAAAEVVELINNNDGEAIRAMGTEELQAALTDEALAPVFDAINAKGEFQGITKTQLAGTKDQSKNEYAVAVLTAKYTEGTATFTISFDTDMRLAGLYYR